MIERVVIVIGPCHPRLQDEDGYRVSVRLEHVGKIRELARTSMWITQDGEIIRDYEENNPPDELANVFVAMVLEGEHACNIVKNMKETLGSPIYYISPTAEQALIDIEHWISGIPPII